MRHTLGIVTLVLIAAGSIHLARAGAGKELRIKTERDSQRNRVFLLVNKGGRSIRADVRWSKVCGEAPEADRSRTTEYWIRPGETVLLGKAWPDSSCRHRYRVLEAAYEPVAHAR